MTETLREEVPTYRRLDDPTRPLWGLSFRSLGILAAGGLLCLFFIRSGVVPLKPALALVCFVAPWPIGALVLTEGRATSPMRELAGFVGDSALRRGPDTRRSAVRDGLVLTELPTSTPVYDEADDAMADWTQALTGATEEGVDHNEETTR